MLEDFAGSISEAAIELNAMREFYEKTGKSFFNLSPTEKRKVIEKFEEDNQ